jgi:hypothetical protein
VVTVAMAGGVLVGCSSAGDDAVATGASAGGSTAAPASSAADAPSTATAATADSTPASTAAEPTTTARATTSTLPGAVTTATPDPAGDAGSASTTLPARPSGLVLAPDGVGVIAFGATAENVAVTVGDVLGPSQSGSAGECDAGPLDSIRWGTTLTAYLQGGRFAGWFTRSGELRTAERIGVGSTASALAAAYGSRLEVTTGSLGVEWTVRPTGPSGLLSGAGPDATVDAVWAGVICAAR